MTFGKEFTQAVEQKQIAQQGTVLEKSVSFFSQHTDSALLVICAEAERAKFIVERVSCHEPSFTVPALTVLYSSFPSLSLSKSDKLRLYAPKEKQRLPLSSREHSTRLEKVWSSSVASKPAKTSPVPWPM